MRVKDAYYIMRTFIESERAAAVKSERDRLGHASEETIKQMKRGNLVIGMNSVRENSWESCITGKTCKKSHPRIDGRKTKRIMELWHVV